MGSPGPDDLEHLIEQDRSRLAAEQRLRSRRVVTPVSSTRAKIEGREGEVLNFASNNYLGLTHHPRVVEAVRLTVETYGAGSGAAGLITGYSELHRGAERALAGWKGTQDAVLLPSGYQANHAVVQTLAALGGRGGGVRFLVDKLAHASLIDAVRGAGAEMRLIPHNHLGKVRRLLEDAPAGELQVVVTESIFSMDGDSADLEGLVALKRERPFVLVLDEAHGSGVYGANGSGLARELGLDAHVDVSVVTLSKALGGVGGAVCASEGFCGALVNHGRAYVFSTGVPAGVCGGCAAAIEVMREEPWRQARVRELARRVRGLVAAMGFDVPAGDSPIVPVILGGEESALRASEELLGRGLLVPAVRPPTVARGASRLRVTLSCEHSEEEVGRLVEGLGVVTRAGTNQRH